MLGVPFNILQYYWLLIVASHWLGFLPGNLNITFNDAHLYENHAEQAAAQLGGRTYEPPLCHFSPPQGWSDLPAEEAFQALSMDHFKLAQPYEHAGKLLMNVAV